MTAVSTTSDRASQVVRQAMNDPVFRDAWRHLERRLDRYVDEIIRVTEIPAPPFGEEDRARYVAGRLREIGLDAVRIDDAGNVVGHWPAGPGNPRRGNGTAGGGGPASGTAPGLSPVPAPARRPPGAVSPTGPAESQAGPVVISAHLDTVFPAGTPIRVRRRGNRLYAPGIGDNASSVACLLMLAEALAATPFAPHLPVIWLFNTGEEGLGNLRGMRHFLDTLPRAPAAVLVVDGGLGMISYRGIGSRRLRAVFTGPGGHSWKDFGRPSAIHGAGRAVARLSGLPVPSRPRTTWNVGRIQGGTTVNTIAARCELEIDLRSEDGSTLRELEQAVRRELRAAAREEGVEVAVEVIGHRPEGSLPPDHDLVCLVRAAMAACGVPVHELAASTDANLPLSRGIAAVTFGIRHGDGAHTLNEYIDRTDLDRGLRLALLALLACVRWAERALTRPGGGN
ncbi:MAG TPA: M20/M25/M40 family metallo-hydrolase [Thermaerobacter sp.]